MSFIQCHFLRIWFSVWIVLLTTSAFADQPNVIFVITDDQGYGDLSCHGNPTLKTPALDELYRNSIRLTDYHVAPTCSPTRSAIQTGRWQNRVGVWHTITDRCMLFEDETTMGQLFSRAGYSTGMFGKWHLGDNFPYRPEDRGYDEVLRHGGGGVGQTPDFWDNAYFDDTYFRNGKPEKQKGFCTDVFFDAATKFIKSQHDSKKPFFAYIATNAPHGPFHSPEEFSQPYKKLGIPTANFLGMIANIDGNVGKLLKFLQENDIAENTIFVFTTDNGTAMGHKVFNGNMRGNKGSEYDGGHRVPMFFQWPKGKLVGGRDVEPVCAHVDVLPTLMDLCEIDVPAKLKLDGKSLKPLLYGKQIKWPDRVLITDSQRIRHPEKWRKSSVMTSRWRLVNQNELYDMDSDPMQQNDVASDHKDVVQRLQKAYNNWWDDIQPSFKRINRIHLGLESGEIVNLTSHDWTTNGGSPWNQAAIRRGAYGKNVRGYWNVKVLQDGIYKVSIRRWPRESKAAIDSELAAGADVPGTAAFRTTPGVKISPNKGWIRIGANRLEKRFVAGSQEMEFEVELRKGQTELEAGFLSADGEQFGAYYAYVEKL